MSQLHATEAEKSPEMIALDAEIKENVLKGIEFLKKQYGEDYVDHIDMDKFDIRAGNACVLGQVHPAYYGVESHDDGYLAACAKFFYGDSHGGGAIEFGFNIDEDDIVYDRGFGEEVSPWNILQETWEKALAVERKTVARKRQAGIALEAGKGVTGE